MDYIELDIHVKPYSPWSEVVISKLAENGFESFTENDQRIQAYIPTEQFDSMNTNELLQSLKNKNKVDTLVWEEKTIPHQNWNAVWESDFQPVEVGEELIISAPFHNVKKNYKMEVVIQPQMSFGTGHHSTTWLIAKWFLNQQLENKSVLDMGTGTGILAILAKKCGAYSVLGIDIEEGACENAMDNVALNDASGIEIVLGDEKSIPKGSKFDFIIANINKNILLSHLKTYVKHLNPDGKIVMSGFFETDVEEITKAAELHNLCLKNTYSSNNWAAIELELKN